MIKTVDNWSKGYEILRDIVTFSEERSSVIPELPHGASLSREAISKLPVNTYEDKSYRYTAQSPSEVKDFVTNAILSLGYSDFSICEQLEELATKMMQKFKTNYLKCRMDLVYSDSCRKFHIDNLYARSITTLIGPGTEFKSQKKSCQIQQVNTGETILLKGIMYPGKRSKTLHRSPPIAHLGIHRLVFVMDC